MSPKTKTVLNVPFYNTVQTLHGIITHLRYNLGTLQNRLDSSQPSAPLEAISQIGTSLSHPTTSGIATVNTFVILVYQAVEQVKDLKNILLHIKLLKQKYQSDRISQAVGKELLTLEQRKNDGFSHLSEKN